MALNRMSQEELEQIEAEAAFFANNYISLMEADSETKIGNQKYGEPKLPEDV